MDRSRAGEPASGFEADNSRLTENGAIPPNMRTLLHRLRYTLTVALALPLLHPGLTAEPNWHYPDFQKPAVEWLKSITEDDVAVEVVPIPLPELSEADARLYFPASGGKYSLLSVVATQLSTPPGAYLWDGGIWRPDEPLIQDSLKDESHGLESGQIWIPGHPNAANVLAWIYQLDEPWNPYYQNQAVATRAAIISMVDLLVYPEQAFYWGDERSTKPGRKFIGRDGTWNVHPGQAGFTLTFHAFTMLHLSEAMPSEVVETWEKGFRLIAGRFDGSGNTGPGNMLLSAPVAFYYAYLATGMPYYRELYQRWEDRIVTGPLLSPAGVYYDGFNRAPDASYEGISLHRIAELYAINPSETLRGILDRAYTLKRYFTLVEPDGTRFSPSHFNDRSASGFAHDQYAGREVMIAGDVPAAAPFLRAVWRENVDPAQVARNMVSESTRMNRFSPGPYPWGAGQGSGMRMHDWEGVLHLPYVLYREDHETLVRVLEEGPGYPLLESERYTRNFADEFHAIRRPAYAALFYTGVANAHDTGRTNLHGTVQGDGGYFNGFAGGGLSAFWVPEVGTSLIGRKSATEGYQRSERNPRFVPGWQDWANNHIVGETREGKILTSARTSRPENAVVEGADGLERLEIAGNFVQELRQQGQIIEHPASYRRSYAFHDTHIEVKVGVSFSGPTEFNSLFETLPLYLAEDMQIRYLDAESNPIDPVETLVSGVSYVILQREAGGTCIAFPDPVDLALISKSFVSRQQGPAVTVQALQIAFPETSFEAAESSALFYGLIPFKGPWSADEMPPMKGSDPETQREF